MKKKFTSKAKTFVTGGKGHMVGKQNSGPRGKGGPSGQMVGKQSAKPAKPC